VVVALPENEVAGRVCMNRAKDRTPGVAEFEIIIAKKFWGRRLGREVATLMIPAAFNELNAKAVRAEVHPENKASLGLLDCFGFKYKCKATKEPMLLYEVERIAGCV
jgi:RimJ/RimL family protein N-acetyltransferase